MTDRALRWFVLFAGYPLLAFLIWVWLGIPEATVWQILGSVVLAMVVVGGMVLLVALTLADSWRVRPFLGRSGLLVLCFVVTVAICVWLGGKGIRFAEWLALRISTWRNTVETPEAYGWALPALLIAFVLLTMALLLPPLAIGSARPLRSIRYWAAWMVAALIGVWLPWRLLQWVPSVSGVTAQSVSLSLRLLAGYVLALSCYLAVFALLRRYASPPPGRPHEATEAR